METIQIITALLKERGISAAKMSRDLGFSNAVFYQWKKGVQSPSLSKLSAMAEYFNVPIEQLLNPLNNSINTGDISNSGHNVIGIGDNSPVLISSERQEAALPPNQEQDLVKIFKMLDGKRQLRLMSLAYKLEDEIKDK